MIVLLFGPPGCGKGTQAASIAHRFQIPAISTGDMFRAECKAGTELGRLACNILKSGGLVGDEIVDRIVAARIQQPDCASGRWRPAGHLRPGAMPGHGCVFFCPARLPAPLVNGDGQSHRTAERRR